MTGVLIKVLRKLHLLRRVVVYTRRTIGGRSIRIPIYLDIGGMHLVDRDPWMLPLLQHLLAGSNGTFVDAGANIGQTLLRVHAISPSTPYLGFEPNPLAVAYIRELLRANSIGDKQLICAALGGSDGVQELEHYHGDPADASASTVPGFKQGHPIEGRTMVPLLHFDTHANTCLHGSLGVVKVDVEGAEFEVLAGMKEHLKRDRPAIVLHLPPVHRDSHTERLHRQEKMQGLLSSLDYRLHRILWDGTCISLHAITGPIGIHSEPDWSNYLAVHVSREAAFLSGFPTVDQAGQ